MALFEDRNRLRPHDDTDPRDARTRRHFDDYLLRPDAVDERKGESYMYTGYYYSMMLGGVKPGFSDLRWLCPVAALVEFGLLVLAGISNSAMNIYGWLALPYALAVLGAFFAMSGAIEIAFNSDEEFVRKTRDKGINRFRSSQLTVLAFSAGTGLVMLVLGFKYISTLGISALLAPLASLAAAVPAIWLYKFFTEHPPKIVRDGMEEYKRLQKEMEDAARGTEDSEDDQ